MNNGSEPSSTAGSYDLCDGDFICDGDPEWTKLRGGFISKRDGELFIRFFLRLPDEKDQTPFLIPLAGYEGRVFLNILSHAEFKRRLSADPTPWNSIHERALEILRDAPGRELNLVELISSLQGDPSLNSSLIEDTLKMMVCKGIGEVRSVQSGLLYRPSAQMMDFIDRREYFATTSNELLAKSRRIDLLVAHSGTVGSYREGLLRSTLRQALPRQYEVSTGFIAGCSRQLDVIVWESATFAPLFRDNDVVVVPRQSVRAVIEVKTTLDTNSLDEAMHILWEVFHRNASIIPVFKGIFCYESTYKTDFAVAGRMKDFYGKIEPDGIVAHDHWYMFAGITAICVPNKILVRERYRIGEPSERSYPQPFLSGFHSPWPGDNKMAIFLGILFSYLDLPRVQKTAATAMYEPILSWIDTVELLDIYDGKWVPRVVDSEMNKALQPAGACLYFRRVQEFLSGNIMGANIADGLRE